ncbi:MAG: ferredoxin family protein [Armatimonadota bacterium]
MPNKVVVDENLCKGCGLCINFCPKNVLKFSDHLNAKGFYPAVQADEKLCTACGICYMMCPDAAITVYKDEKAKASV